MDALIGMDTVLANETRYNTYKAANEFQRSGNYSAWKNFIVML